MNVHVGRCAFCAPTVCKAAQWRNLKLDYVCFDVVTYPFDLVLCFAEYCLRLKSLICVIYENTMSLFKHLVVVG